MMKRIYSQIEPPNATATDDYNCTGWPAWKVLTQMARRGAFTFQTTGIINVFVVFYDHLSGFINPIFQRQLFGCGLLPR